MASATSHPTLPTSDCVDVPDGVAHDGSRNVSLLLQAVLDTVPDGGCLRLHPDGRYRDDGTLLIMGRNNLTIDGNGAVLFTDGAPPLPPGAAKSKRPHIQVLAGENVTIENITIDGPNGPGGYHEAFETDHAFDVKGADGLTIRNSSARQVYGDFIYVDDTGWPLSSGITRPTTNLLVSGNTFRNGGRHGFAVGGIGIGLRFEGNVVRKVRRSAVDFELNPNRTISQIEIVGNTFRAFRLNWIAAGEGSASDVYIAFNTIVGDSMHSKMAPRTVGYVHERWTFEGNVSDTEHRSDRTVFYMARVQNFTFIGNVQPMYPGGSGRVFGNFGDVCGITLVDNDFANYQELFYPTEPGIC